MPKKQTEWSRNYNEKAYDRMAVTVPKGRRADVDAYARSMGTSVNGLINALLMEKMQKSPEEWKLPGDNA